MSIKKRTFVLNIIKELGNIKGEMFLQKLLYFLSYYKVGEIYYHYDKNHYGPYSYELKGDLNYFENEGFIDINSVNRTHYIIPNEQKINEFLIDNQKDLKNGNRDYLIRVKILDIFNNDLRTLDRIELFSTMHILVVHDKIILKEQVFKAVENWKPERFTLEDKKKIWKILIGYKMIPETVIEVNDSIEKLNNITTGHKDAYKYHRFIEKILKKLFEDQLTNFRIEDPINWGRKRIDFDAKNNSKSGFFSEIRKYHNIKCPFIMFESKNISHDLKTPHYDQMIGRFSFDRGYFGIITCRKIENKVKLLKQLRDIYNKNSIDKYIVLVIDDNDIKEMLILKERGLRPDEVLELKLKELIFNCTRR
ncbi:MAG: hypothetical protein ACFFCE_16710 [Promethearchaeota archaeon]